MGRHADSRLLWRVNPCVCMCVCGKEREVTSLPFSQNNCNVQRTDGEDDRGVWHRGMFYASWKPSLCVFAIPVKDIVPDLLFSFQVQWCDQQWWRCLLCTRLPPSPQWLTSIICLLLFFYSLDLLLCLCGIKTLSCGWVVEETQKGIAHSHSPFLSPTTTLCLVVSGICHALHLHLKICSEWSKVPLLLHVHMFPNMNY